MCIRDRCVRLAAGARARGSRPAQTGGLEKVLKTPEMLVRVRKAINEEPRALARYVRVVMAAAKESGQSTEYGKLAAFAVATLHTQSPGVVTVNGEEWPLRVRASYEAVAASLVELGYAEAEVPSKAAVVLSLIHISEPTRPY